jgi:cell division protein FtsQ
MRPRHRRWLAPAIVVLVVLALAGAAYAVTYSSLFDASQVVVRGVRHVSVAEVRRVSGLEPGVNVLHTDLRRAADRVRSLEWISDVSITRELPDVLIVVVRERVAVGQATVEGSPSTVTADGHVIPGRPAKDLPIIQASIGTTELQTAGAAGRQLATMAPRMRRRVSAVLVLLDGSFLIQMDDGVSVTWGSGEEAAQKSAALGAVLAWARGEGVRLETVDVSAPEAPTARLAGGATVLPS